MAEPFLGEIRMFGFGFAPRGWTTCSGQLLPIAQNAALFSLLGTTYGGNGTSTFQLPDLRGRTPVSQGQLPGGGSYRMGQVVGSEGVQLHSTQMPTHNHLLHGQFGGRRHHPADRQLSFRGQGRRQQCAAADLCRGRRRDRAARGRHARLTGGNQAHPNMQPYLVTNYCIALQGIFPSRN